MKSRLYIQKKSIYYEKIHFMDDDCTPYLQSSDVNIMLFRG